jgi:hypothetical protein
VINFRYHVVSLVAVLLALAVGIALGGGPLQRTPDDETSSGGDEQTLVSAQAAIDELEEGTAFADDYTDRTAGDELDRALQGRAVTILTLPGADDAHVTELSEMVDRAGGTVTTEAVATEKLLDVGNRQLVSELASQMAASAETDLDMPDDVSGYEQMALLLAYALVAGKAGGDDLDGTGESVLAGLATADLLTVDGQADNRGSLVLVVAGEPFGSPDVREGAGTIVATFLAALDDRSDGVVLAGPVASSADDGLVSSVRADPTTADIVSTVDAIERTAGAVVAVLALQDEAKGKSGHYGTADAPDGTMPGQDKD